MPANFVLQDFITQVAGGGLARTNRYEVTITGPGAARLSSLYAEVTQFAPMTIKIKPNRIFGPPTPKPIFPEYGGMQFPITFILDRDMFLKRYFDDWMHQVTVPGYFHVNYLAAYARDIYIRQLDEGNNLTYEMRLVQAWPHSMSPIELDHGNKNGISRLQVLFAYRYWETTEAPDVAGTVIQHLDPAGTALQPLALPPEYDAGVLVGPPAAAAGG